MSAKKLNVCIVGLGRAGHVHLRSLASLGHKVHLAWVVDIDADVVRRVCERHGCKGTADIDEALADGELDALVIASATFTHFDYTTRALNAKKAVFTEKPISHDPEELASVLRLAIASNLVFCTGYQRRCDANFRALKRQLDEGAIGGVRLIKCTSRDNPEPPLEYLKVSGGIFHDMLCHDFDMLHFLTGQFPCAVYSAGHCYNPQIAAIGDCDTVIVTLKFASGLLATVDTSRIAGYGYDQRIEVLGELGMAQADNVLESTVTVATARGFLGAPCTVSFPQRYVHTYLTELDEFVEQARARTPEPEALTLRHIMLEKVTTAAELSWRLGREVRIEDVDGLRSQVPLSTLHGPQPH